jgi:hypothetical protein
MKHAIYPDRTGSITASSENGAYPATNLASDYRKKVWKAVASVQVATLTVPIAAYSGGIALYNTNATSASVSVTRDVGGATVYSGAWTIDEGRYWQEWTRETVAITAAIELTTTAATVEAGIVRAGDVLSMKNPKSGINETLTDHSIKKQLRNGAIYTKKLEMIRRLSWSCLMARETHYRDLMELYEYYGPDPFAMLITDNVSGSDDIWTVFGAFDGVPSASHDDETYSNVSINILEAV